MYYSVWSKLSTGCKWAAFKTSGLLKFYLLPLDEMVKGWLKKLLTNRKLRKQVFDPSLLKDNSYLLLYMTKMKSSCLRSYKTLKELQTEQKQGNLFERIIDQAEIEKLSTKELIKKIREGLTQWENVVMKLNELTDAKKARLEKILRQILDQEPQL